MFYEYSKHENENVVMAWMAIAKESHIISYMVEGGLCGILWSYLTDVFLCYVRILLRALARVGVYFEDGVVAALVEEEEFSVGL